MTDSGMMHIGELAERTELSLRTIRHYDEIGLLKPSGRSDGGFRLYTDADLERLFIIRRMKPLGFSLEEMAELLRIIDIRHTGDAEARRVVDADYERYVTEAEERRSQLQRQLDMADEFLARLRSA
ncbi:MerR family transcriptional regulator [Agromyces sp. NPDC058064]|uniref:MerR family transcriptional regulator n=1 Tax=Agromyces sp. NPDC058064 TaxID=3346322 RepID=UPI0036D7ABD3